MIFPLSIKYSTKINSTSTDDDSVIILQYITDQFRKLGIKDFNQHNNIVIFNISFSDGLTMSKNHIFGSINSGYFSFDKRKKIIQYEFDTVHMAMIVLTMSIFIAITSQELFTTFIAFSFLYGVNILISTIRLYFFTRKLKKEIETYFP